MNHWPNVCFIRLCRLSESQLCSRFKKASFLEDSFFIFCNVLLICFKSSLKPPVKRRSQLPTFSQAYKPYTRGGGK